MSAHKKTTRAAGSTAKLARGGPPDVRPGHVSATGSRSSSVHNKLTTFQERRAAFKASSSDVSANRDEDPARYQAPPSPLPYSPPGSPCSPEDIPMHISTAVELFTDAPIPESKAGSPETQKSLSTAENTRLDTEFGTSGAMQDPLRAGSKREKDHFAWSRTPGLELYERLVGEFNGDTLTAWFEVLGLPCHPDTLVISGGDQERVKMVTPSAVPSLLESQSGSVATAPPTTIVQSGDEEGETDDRAGPLPEASAHPSKPIFWDNERLQMPTNREEYYIFMEGYDIFLGEVEEEVRSKRKGKTATASTLTQELLTEHCGWDFRPYEELKKEIERIPKKETTYTKKYQYPASHEGFGFHHNIVTPPIRLIDKNQLLSLDRHIGNHLAYERYRLHHKKLRRPKLVIPEEWKAEVKGPEPPFYEIPKRYRNHLPLRKQVVKRTPQRGVLQAVSDPGKPTYPTVAADKEEAAQVIATKNGIKLSVSTQEERDRGENICKQHGLDRALDDDQRTYQTAKAYAELLKANLEWHKHFSKRVVVHALEKNPRLMEECVSYLPRQRIQLLDANGERDGDATHNEDTEHLFQYPPFIVARFLSFSGSTEKMYSEGSVEKIIGGLLKGIITGKELNARDNSSAQFVDCLKPFGSHPSPDAFVRVAKIRGWPKSFDKLLPVLFAGECKPRKRYNEKNIRAQLAVAFHGSLIVLILYYLDTRPSLTAPLPPWLFLYGIEYTEAGVSICAHHPSYDYESTPPRWRLVSKIVTESYSDVFMNGDPIKVTRLLAALFKIRSHCLYVLDQLKKWDRARAVLSVLLDDERHGNTGTA